MEQSDLNEEHAFARLLLFPGLFEQLGPTQQYHKLCRAESKTDICLVKYQWEQSVPNFFFDVLINNDSFSCYQCLLHGLLTNYFSFTSNSYKLGLIRTLVDRAYKINNTWFGFHEDVTKLTNIL